MSETTHLRNAVFNAVSNAMRKKGKKFQDLWKKKQKRLDKELANENLQLITKMEERDGKGWVDLVYQANGLNRRGGGGRGRLYP